MTLFKKNHPDAAYHSFLEFLIVTGSLIAILVPIRVFSKIVFADEWIGSLGVVTGVLGLIIFLSKKEKLGKFGQMFIRQVIKNHKGKRKWFIYFQTILFLSIAIFTIFSIHTGNNDYYLLKEQVLAEFQKQGIMIDSSLNFDAIKQISSQITPEQQMGAIAALPLLTIQNFEVFAVVLAITDQLMGGWVMYFWQIMLIETVEIIVMLRITRKIFFKKT